MHSGSKWNERMGAYSAAGMASPFWPREDHASGSRGWWSLGPVAFVGMVLGFVFFWPVGLAILFYNFWRRKGEPMPIFQMMERAFEKSSFAQPKTGNMAFDDWKRTELERIEKERQRLLDAEREFAMFSSELRRARDREEFERFMQARKPTGDTPAA